ncbi:MAG: glycosyltransferase [Bacteroidia bacterium]|nr:glycosyltransferase [Bacteroidia bacterium]
MAIPPLQLPSWLSRHLLVATHPDQLAPTELMRIRQGLSRFRSEGAKASIVIPAYNEGANIIRTLSSLAELVLPDEVVVELLVVDDASTDSTPDWLHALGVHHIRLPENSSPKEARRLGLEACHGEIVLQADADSVYPAQWGKRYLEVLEHEGVSIVYGGHSFLPDPRAGRLALATHEALGNVARSLRRRHREHINVHGFNSAFWRGQGLQYGSYDHDPLGSEDGHMALKLSKVGQLRYCPGTNCKVWTSPRRLLAKGGLAGGSIRRIKKEVRRMGEYLTGRS